MRVLLIEDDPDILKLAALTLRLDGRFEVLKAISGKRGLALAKTEQPDLIVLDVVMPDIDGYETLRRLKADPETAAIPVVILSIKGEEKDRQLGLALGAVEYLMKPYDPMKLPGRLLELVAKA